MEGENSTFVGPNWRLDYGNLPKFFICFLGIISQSLLLYAFLKDPLKCFKKSGTFLVINLAVADLLMCLFAPVYVCAKATGWHEILRFIAYAAISVSTVTITSISIDRFLLVTYPIKHYYFIKGNTLLIWLACIWIVGIVFPTKQAILGKQAYDSITISFLCGTIVIFSSFMYALTYFNLRKQLRNMQALQSSTESRAHVRHALKQKQFLKTIITIACTALICLIPPTILRSTLFDKILVLRYLSFCMLYINFSINPLIYVLRLPNYRKTFYLLYCSLRR